MTLTLYKQKRNFKSTPEPSNVKGKKNTELSFVVQRHDASHLHYDFRLEMDGVLKSWAIPKGPSMKAGDKRLAVLVEDHPLKYGKFYGEIPEGNYGAGIVEIWDNGTYLPAMNTEEKNIEKDVLTMFDKGDLKFILNGNYLKGEFALVRMYDAQGKKWLLIKKKDEYAVKVFNIEKLKPVHPFEKKKNTTSTEIRKTTLTSSSSKKKS